MAAAKRIVLITGGNNGIGLAACELFAAQPGYHCIMASRSLDKGRKSLDAIKSADSSANISLVQLDITSDDSIASAVNEVQNAHGHLDVLINNAGICPNEMSRSLLRETLETNATSPALVTEAFAPLLLKSKEPRLIYVSSILGSIAKRESFGPMLKAYGISKAALNMLAAYDAVEYKDKMKVFAFCPGYVVTDLAGWREKKEKEAHAKSPDTSARSLLIIADGKRDEEHGKFLHDDQLGELYPW